jgi:hypothetical protein
MSGLSAEAGRYRTPCHAGAVVTGDARGPNAPASALLLRIEARRARRNDFFHSTHLLDLNFHARDCVEAFCDLLD